MTLDLKRFCDTQLFLESVVLSTGYFYMYGDRIFSIVRKSILAYFRTILTYHRLFIYEPFHTYYFIWIEWDSWKWEGVFPCFHGILYCYDRSFYWSVVFIFEDKYSIDIFIPEFQSYRLWNRSQSFSDLWFCFFDIILVEPARSPEFLQATGIEYGDLLSASIGCFFYIYESTDFYSRKYYRDLLFLSETVRPTVESSYIVLFYLIECTYKTLFFFWIGSCDDWFTVITTSSIEINLIGFYTKKISLCYLLSIRTYVEKYMYRTDQIGSIIESRNTFVIVTDSELIIIYEYRAFGVRVVGSTYYFCKKYPASEYHE